MLSEIVHVIISLVDWPRQCEYMINLEVIFNRK